MQPSLLEEVASVPNPYPIRAEIEHPEVWRLCEQARELAWDPRAIDFADLRAAELPAEVRAAGAEWWSLRAWMEHGAVPYGSERLRDAVFGHQPFEIKQHVVNFIAGYPVEPIDIHAEIADSVNALGLFGEFLDRH
mgnify:CR=1 FL=1